MGIAGAGLVLCCCSYAQQRHTVAPAKAPLAMRAPLQDKNFYVLSTMEEDVAVRKALLADPMLQRIAAERREYLGAALQRCHDADCVLNATLWTDEEIHTAALALRRLYATQGPVRRMVDGRLRASGAYVLDQSLHGDDLLADAWEISMNGVNHVIRVYGLGEKPRYPAIDSISVDTSSAEFRSGVEEIARSVAADKDMAEGSLFFDPSLKMALHLMTINHRDEAARYEPMEDDLNNAAIEAVRTTRWSRYPYSVIVVPGAGPSDRATALSAMGRRRVELAVEAYRKKMAPFILVSGGFVHPSQTRFSEAIEMKRALVHDYGVPESAVIADPHARHTTTNMRNAAREMYRYGVPMERPALVVTDAAQDGYIEGQVFASRCEKELGYLPYQIVRRISPTTLVFEPKVESLEQDPQDPLDP